MNKQNSRLRQTILPLLNLIMSLFLLNFMTGCQRFLSSSTTVSWTPPNAGQTLKGYYEHGVPVESYTFREDGSYVYNSSEKTASAVSGTYRVEGKTIRLEANGKTETQTVSVPKEDVGKASPSKVDLNFTTYEFVSDDQLARRQKSSTVSNSSTEKNTLPAEYGSLAPERVGEFARIEVSKDAPGPQSKFIEKYQFNYEKNNYFYITKFATESDAQAALKKRISEAVTTAEYDKKVKLPKCDTTKETDYDTPEELVKTIPLGAGGEAIVFHPSKFWDYKCKLVSNGEETVSWTKGVYVFSILSSQEHSYDDYTMAFGRAESFFNKYLAATGQK